MKEHLKAYDEKMTKTLNALNHEFASIRAGRANPAVLDKVQVDYYGVPTAEIGRASCRERVFRAV